MSPRAIVYGGWSVPCSPAISGSMATPAATPASAATANRERRPAKCAPTASATIAAAHSGPRPGATALRESKFTAATSPSIAAVVTAAAATATASSAAGRRTPGRLRLDGDAPGRHAEQQQPLAALLEELVDGLARALPPAVVVDQQHASGRQPRVEVLELVPGGLVPVGVEPQDRDLLRGPIGDRLLHQPLHEVHPLGRIRHLREALLHVVE